MSYCSLIPACCPDTITGTEIAGKPARLAGTVNTSATYASRGDYFDAVFTAKHPLAAQGADKVAKENDVDVIICPTAARLAGTVNTSATYASRGDFLVELLIKSDNRGGDVQAQRVRRLVQQDFDAVFTAKHPLAAQGADKVAKHLRHFPLQLYLRPAQRADAWL
jgi:hypothetical protein